jgi:hypothetical protein
VATIAADSSRLLLPKPRAREGDLDGALAILDEAVATSERIGYPTFDTELYRVRGGMLLKRSSRPGLRASRRRRKMPEIAEAQALLGRSLTLLSGRNV